jgi:hypothetical protein
MIKQRKTTTKTASATLTLAEMGDIICNSSTAQTYTLPTASLGLWYNFSNVGTGTVSISNGTVLATIEQYQQALAINNGTAWYVSLGGGGDVAFTDLTDAPSSYTGSAGKILKVNSAADGIEFGDAASGGGATSFTGLDDVPDSYVGQGGKIVKVKATADGIEFAEIASGGTSTSSVNIGIIDGGDSASAYSEEQIFTGVPSGGTAGQILSKVDGTDFNTQWITINTNANPLDTPPTTPSAYDDEFDDNTVNSKWLWINQSTSSAEEIKNSFLKLNILYNSSPQARGIVEPCPTTNFTVTTKFYATSRYGNYPKTGIFISESLTGKCCLFDLYFYTGSVLYISHELFSAPATRSSYGTNVAIHPLTVYLKTYIYNDSGTWKADCSTSKDGFIWIPYSTITLGFVPAYVGLGADNEGGTQTDNYYYEWFRVTQ